MDIEKELQEICERMSEHVDSIRIMVTTHENGQTTCDSFGMGNWYAQKASVEEWLKRGEQQDQAQFIAEEISPPEDDSESWKS